MMFCTAFSKKRTSVHNIDKTRGILRMRRGTLTVLLFIILLAAAAVYIDLPNTPGIHILGINNPLQVKLGLDLQGAVSALLVPDPSQHYNNQTLINEIPPVRDNIEQRVNDGLGGSQ